MLSREAATQLVRAYLDQAVSYPSDVIERATVDRATCFVFFYQSRQYLQTKDFRFALFGNSPIIVDKSDHSFHFCGTALPFEQALADWEAGKWRDDNLAYWRKANGIDR